MEMKWLEERKIIVAQDAVGGPPWHVHREVSARIEGDHLLLSLRDKGGSHSAELTWEEWDRLALWVQFQRLRTS